MSLKILDETFPIQEKYKVKGVIYIMTCITTSKKYVGQTLTHRLNKGFYKPFGSYGRFKDHISEAINNTKKNQCVYLNNAIRKYGQDKFTYETILICEKHSLDLYEEKFIALYDSLYPAGYNLTKGGKNKFCDIKIMPNEKLNEIRKIKNLGRVHSIETRKKMSETNKKVRENINIRKQNSLSSKIQHDRNKVLHFSKFDIQIDVENTEKYIHKVYSKKDGSFLRCKVILGDNKITFQGKYDTEEEIFNKANMFLKSIGKKNWDDSIKNINEMDDPQPSP